MPRKMSSRKSAVKQEEEEEEELDTTMVEEEDEEDEEEEVEEGEEVPRNMKKRNTKKGVVKDEAGSKSRRQIATNDEESEEDEEIKMAEKEVKRNTKKRSTSKGSRSKRKNVIESDDDEDNEDNYDRESSQDVMKFSSQAPDLTQDIGEVKEFERNNLKKLSSVQREKVITDLTRLVLFKALAGEAIDRTKCIKEAGINDARISSAAFDEVNIRLRNMFDFELIRQPEWMNKLKGLNTTRFTKDRYYMINALQEQVDGVHSRELHSIHEHSSIEKGLLIMVLAFAYCKGEPRSDGSRWILDKHLYQLLNKVDENIPAEPPVYGSKRNRTTTNHSFSQSSGISRRFSTDGDDDSRRGGGGVSSSPDVDNALEKFVKRDYLLKEKASDEQINESGPDVDESSIYYAMGPRAAVEIGRKQVIVFCAEILEEEVDPTMINEIDEGQDVEEENEMVGED